MRWSKKASSYFWFKTSDVSKTNSPFLSINLQNFLDSDYRCPIFFVFAISVEAFWSFNKIKIVDNSLEPYFSEDKATLHQFVLCNLLTSCMIYFGYTIDIQNYDRILFRLDTSILNYWLTESFSPDKGFELPIAGDKNQPSRWC